MDLFRECCVGAFDSWSVNLQAVGDLVTLFDLHAQEGDPGRGAHRHCSDLSNQNGINNGKVNHKME